MPKRETLHIQNIIQQLGEGLGFISKTEERLHQREHYAPVYDVVWYLDLTKQFRLDGLRRLFVNQPTLFERIRLLPFAGFEIEGASTSSKNQLGNFANLYSGNFLYHFVIVNNDAANGENDTYRRGVKLKRYFAYNSGDKNVFFVDLKHLEQSLEGFKPFYTGIEVPDSDAAARKTFGGETASVPIYEKIRPLLENTGLALLQNYQPWLYDVKYKMAKEAVCGMAREAAGETAFSQMYAGTAYYKNPCDNDISISKKAAEFCYAPKLDVCLGFYAPKAFTAWLSALADALGCGIAHFPILYALKRKLVTTLFVPLIGIEIEAGINKHLNGGIYNLEKNTYAGVVVTGENAQRHVEFYKRELGLKNVTAYCIED